MPALFLTQYAQARLWMHWGIEPAALIGHSMGEYTAACLAGVFYLADALALVTTRARLFETLTDGGMLSVPLGAGELEPLLGTELSIAAANGPALSVASGPVAAIERLMRALAGRGMESSRLRVDVAAHSKLLEPILPSSRFCATAGPASTDHPDRFQPDRHLDDGGGRDQSGLLAAAPAADGAIRRWTARADAA